MADMEKLLMDDSSDGSDNEEPASATAAPPAAAAAPLTNAPTNKSELSQRLKSLYSPANHAAKKQPPAPVPVPPVASQPQQQQQQPPSYTSPPVLQQQQQQQQQYSSQSQSQQSSQHRLQSSSSPAFGRPSSSSQQRSASSSGQQQQQQQQQSSSSRPSTITGGVPNPVPVPGHPNVPGPSPAAVMAATSRRTSAGGGAGASASASGTTAGTSGGSSSRSTALTAVEIDKRKQKEQFLMFTRVLMKYLETKDPNMHSKVKAIIKDCAERNKRHEPGYESVTASMKERLKLVVGDAYWKRAEAYLAHFLLQKSKRPGSGGSGGGETQAELQQRQEQELERRKRARQLQQQQQQQQQESARQPMAPPQQQAPTQPPPVASPQPVLQQQQPAPTQTVKPARTATSATGGKGGKRAASGGKQAGGKATKKARTNKSSATTTAGRGSKSPQSPTPMSPPGQQQQPQQSLDTPTPMEIDAVGPSMPPAVREYSELMEAVDHSMFFDWTAAGLIMGSNAQKLLLQEEQKNLLYGSTATYNSAATSSSKKTQKEPPTSPSAVEWKRGSAAGTPQPGNKESNIPFALRGWGKRNLVSPRVAWCRVRRQEQPTEGKGAKLKVLYPDAPPMPTPATAWVNEETAEEDPVLCLLSEATQIYVTQVLQKALVCARQRQNLDGIRLWHQQCTAAMEHAKMKQTNGNSTTSTGEADKKFEPPPLSIKLGCDVTCQVARTMGNAALTVKRMEEALERAKPHELPPTIIPSQEGFQLDETTFESASSMGELSLLPPLGNAVDKADYEAKRQFEIYGGKHALEPPFGRVPEKAMLGEADFQRGLELNHFLGGSQSRRFRASTHAFSWNV